MADTSRIAKRSPKDSDQLQSLTNRLLTLATRNMTILIYAGGGALFLALILAGFFWIKNNQVNSANIALMQAMQLYQEPGGEKPADASADLQRRQKALAAMRTVIDQFPDFPQGKAATLYAANLLFSMGSYRESARTVEDLEKVDPDFVRRYNGSYLLARAYEADRDYNRAVAVYAQVRDHSIGEGKGQAMLDMARCYELLNDASKAAEFYQKVLSEFKDTALARTADRKLALMGVQAARP